MIDAEIRELLALAAKAIGLTLLWDKGEPWVRFTAEERARMSICADNGYEWRPHEDDGDSRRLQVALEIGMTFDDLLKYVIVAGPYTHGFSVEYGSDRLTTVRMAVLKCAAEIGRRMP